MDLTQVSLDGGQCNLIGTSFLAFRTQPGACGQPQGACLGNQIADLYRADSARIAAGQTPRNFLSAWGVGSIRDPLAGSPQMGKKRLAIPATQLRNSVVSLSLSADSLKFVVNRRVIMRAGPAVPPSSPSPRPVLRSLPLAAARSSMQRRQQQLAPAALAPSLLGGPIERACS